MTITLQLDDAKAALLREKAKQYGIDVDRLVHASIEDLLSYPDAEFDHAARRVLRKNEELYQRLGQCSTSRVH